jgi:hypothetical protein
MNFKGRAGYGRSRECEVKDIDGSLLVLYTERNLDKRTRADEHDRRLSEFVHWSLDHPEFFGLGPKKKVVVGLKEPELPFPEEFCHDIYYCKPDGIFIHEIDWRRKYRITVCELKLTAPFSPDAPQFEKAWGELEDAMNYIQSYGRRFLEDIVSILLKENGRYIMGDFFCRHSDEVGLDGDCLVVYPVIEGFVKDRIPEYRQPIGIPRPEPVGDLSGRSHPAQI